MYLLLIQQHVVISENSPLDDFEGYIQSEISSGTLFGWFGFMTYQLL